MKSFYQKFANGLAFGLWSSIMVLAISLAYAATTFYSDLPTASSWATMRSSDWNALVDYANRAVKQDTEVLTVTGGKVGIGTASPVDQLQLGGRTTLRDAWTSWSLLQNNIYFDWANYRNIASGGWSNILLNGNYIGFRTASNGSANAIASVNEPMTISGNNVGIGTTSPLDIFHIGTTNANVRFWVWADLNSNAIVGRAQSTNYHVTGTNPGDLAIRPEATKDIVFGTTPTASSAWVERVRINASGNVGIGTTSPGAKLDVNGSIKLNSKIIRQIAPQIASITQDGSGGYGYCSFPMVVLNISKATCTANISNTGYGGASISGGMVDTMSFIFRVSGVTSGQVNCICIEWE